MSNSAPACPDSTGEVLDVVGVGFGPSNLALAIALGEHNHSGSGRELSARFVEHQPGSAGTAACSSRTRPCRSLS